MNQNKSWLIAIVMAVLPCTLFAAAGTSDTPEQLAAKQEAETAAAKVVEAEVAKLKADKAAGEVDIREVQDGTNLDQFGFGPALFVIGYDEEVLLDSKDVRLRGDNTISSSGSKYSTAIGLEVHYGFSFWNKVKCRRYRCNSTDYEASSGHTISPFLGVFDVENGINGVVAGVVYGFWRGDGDFQNRTSMNVGVGYAIHKDRLVLSRGLREGVAPTAGLLVEDYTERKDVSGMSLMISASLGF